MQSDFRLWQESVPQVQRKGGVYRGEPRHKVFFKSPDGASRSVAAMAVRRHQLVIYIIGGEKNLQSGRRLIVESLAFWLESLDCELLMNGIILFDPF
jgi:hypothetical protein